MKENGKKSKTDINNGDGGDVALRMKKKYLKSKC